MNHVLPSTLAQRSTEAVQARFAQRVAAALAEHQAATTSPDTAARLSFAHDQARAAARRARTVSAATEPAVLTSGAAAVLGSGPEIDDNTPWWLRLGALLPLAVLLAGLMLIDSHYTRSQIEAAAEIDAALLADDLPPEAYRDRGFVEFLKSERP